MSPNPPHLVVRFDASGGGDILDLPKKPHPPVGSEVPVVPGDSVDVARGLNFDGCMDTLLFVKRDSTQYCKMVLQLEELAPSAVTCISNFFVKTLKKVGDSYKDFPIRTKYQETLAYEDLNFLKSLARSLDDVPNSLMQEIPADIGTKDKFLDLLEEDLLSTQGIIYKKIDTLRNHIKIYEAGLQRLGERRKTRSIEKILDGNDPIPLDMLQLDSPGSQASNLYSTVTEQTSNTPDGTTPLITVEDNDSLVAEAGSDSSATGLSQGQSNLTLDTIDQPDSLETIPEERFSDDQRAQILTLVKEILGKDHIDLELDDPLVALEVLQEKLGISLDVKDANIISAVATICKSKRIFSSILSSEGQDEATLPGVTASQDDAANQSILANDSERFYTPRLSDPQNFYTIYHTAKSSSLPTSPHSESIDHTPRRPTVATQRSLVDDIHSLPSKQGMVRDLSALNLNRQDSSIGPDLSQTTSQDDIDRHQWDLLHPSVRSKVTHQELSHKDIDFSILPTMVGEEQLQYLGDHIYPFVASQDPKNAKKITQMILELPKNETIPGVRSTNVLKRMIREAQVVLNDKDDNDKDPQDSPMDPQHCPTTDSGSVGTEYHQVHSPVLLPLNDSQSAIFQEVSQQRPMIQADLPPVHSKDTNFLMPSLPNVSTSQWYPPQVDTSYEGPVTSPAICNEMKYAPPANSFTSVYSLKNADHYVYSQTMPNIGGNTHLVWTNKHMAMGPPQVHSSGNLGLGMPTSSVIFHQNEPKFFTGSQQAFHPMYSFAPSPPDLGGGQYRGGNPNQAKAYVSGQFPSLRTYNHLRNSHRQTNAPHSYPGSFYGQTNIQNQGGFAQTGTFPNQINAQNQGGFAQTGTFPYQANAQNHGGFAQCGNFSNQAQAHNQGGFASPMNDPRHFNSYAQNSSPTQVDLNTDQNCSGAIELVLRERNELRSTSFLVQRIVDHLSSASHMNSQELTDLLGSMKENNRALEKLEEKVSKFMKTIVKNKEAIDQYDQVLYSHLKREISQAEFLSKDLQDKLYQSDLILNSERITLSHNHTNSRDLQYKEFSAGRGMNDAHIFEFLSNLETNFKICRVPDNLKAQMLKGKLKGLAKLAISDDLNDYGQICAILMHKFGNPIDILSHILDLHQEVGKIPSKYCQRPPWQKIEDVCKSHLLLIRKAESMSKDRRAWPQIYENSFRNFHLINIISHEWNDDLKAQRDSIDPGLMYKMIVERFETILTTAASNIEFTDSKPKKETKRQDDRIDMDMYALSYGERRSREITVGNCQPQDCHFCSTFQRLGKGRNYYERHLLYGPAKRSFVNNCPNYLSLSIEEKNSFVYSNNFCNFCLRPKSLCKNAACGDDHLIRLPNGKKKTYVCLSPTCKHRIELCLVHKELNKEAINTRQRNLMDRFNIDLNVGIFTTFQSTPTASTSELGNQVSNPNPQMPLAREENPSQDHPVLTATPNRQDDNNNVVDNSILFIPQRSRPYKNGLMPHKPVNKLDQPLLVESTSQLLADGTKLLAGDCRSIFIYSKIQGLTRPLTTLFDCGGGSSLALSNVPGRQLPACKGMSEPVCLQGIGSGKTTGEQYTMLLPLLEGGNVAVEVYSVPEILQPLAKIDLQPALQFMKDSSESDPNLAESLKEEIRKASIFRFIKGNLDLLLGVKLLGIFPTLVHTLSCGLSIFKMKLKPSSSANYCLGGPYQYLSSLQSAFPDGALMLQEVDSCLANWRAYDLAHDHSTLIDPSKLTYEIDAPDSSTTGKLCSNDEVILSVGTKESRDCGCGTPFLNDTGFILCCSGRSELLNSMKSRFIGDKDPFPVVASVAGPYSRAEWLENANDAILRFMQHISSCPVKELDKELRPYKAIEPCDMRKDMGWLFRRYNQDFDLSGSMEFLKNAMCHLDACSPPEPPQHKVIKPNTFIAFQCDRSFHRELDTFQSFFLTYYPEFASAMVPAHTAHLTLLAFNLESGNDLERSGWAFSSAWNKWLKTYPFQLSGSMSMDFSGVGIFDDKILYLKPAYLTEALITLHDFLLSEFKNQGFECDERFTPHLTFARLKSESDEIFNTCLSEVFSNIHAGHTIFHRIEMLSMKKTIQGHYPVLKALPFCQDLTLAPSHTYEGGVGSAEKKSVGTQTSSLREGVETPTAILTFQPERKAKHALRDQIDKYYKAWNNAVDALKKHDIETQMERVDNPLRTLPGPTEPDVDLTEYEQQLFLDKSLDDAKPLGVDHSEMLLGDETTSNNTCLSALTSDDSHVPLRQNIQGSDHSDQESSISVQDEVREKGATDPGGFNKLLSYLSMVLETNNPEPRCGHCYNCQSCKTLAISSNTTVDSVGHKEDYMIKANIQFDRARKKFCVSLPLKEDPSDSLVCNAAQARHFYNKITKALDKNPDDRLAVLKSFKKLEDKGFIQRLADMDKELQNSIMQKTRYTIPWNVVHKDSSLSTPLRIVLNASSRTATKKSLNNILCKGVPKVNMLPLVMALLCDPVLMTLDLQQFYNSCLIPEDQYHLQCIWWQEELDTNKEPEIYIIKTHTYGVVSSGRVLELCLEQVAKENSDNKPFYDLFMKKLYVDDGFANCKSVADAQNLKLDCERILPEYGFKVKGYAESYKLPPPEISDEVEGSRTVGVIGMVWIPDRDVLKFRPPSLDFTGRRFRGKLVSASIFKGSTFDELENFVPRHLTLRMVASKAACFWDPAGLAGAWYLGVKHILRMSAEAVSRRWDDPLPDYLRGIWIRKFWEMLELSKIEFPRCAFPLGETYTELIVVSMSDMGLIGKLQAFYSLKRIGDKSYFVQLLYSKSQLSDKRSVPCQELDSLNSASTILDKICLCLGNVDRKAMLMDSTICAYWLMKDPIQLGVFQRLRVQHILRNCERDEIFHIRSSFNSSDVGTKRPEPISSVAPGSFFSNGPDMLKLGLEECIERSYIRKISEVVLNPSLKDAALDGFIHKDMPEEYFDSVVQENSLLSGAPLTPSPIEVNGASDTLVKEDSQDQQCPEFAVLASNPLLIRKVQDRFSFHHYLVNPLLRPWSCSVRTMSIVLQFIRRLVHARMGGSIGFKDRGKHPWGRIYKRLFCTDNEPLLQDCFTNLCVPEPDIGSQQSQVQDVTHESSSTCLVFKPQARKLIYADLFDDIRSMKKAKESAVAYFLRLASAELRQFYSKTMLRKHAFFMEEIYYSKQRLLEVENITDLMSDEVSTRELGINTWLPCSDRYSPVAISIMMHFHRNVTKHSGVDRTWSALLSSIFIFQGQPLLSEIVKGCFYCRYKLKQKIRTSYGPISKVSLTFAAVNHHVMLDLSGPYVVKTHLHSRTTRRTSNKQKVYLLHTVCLTSFLNCIVIVEDYSSQGFTDALHRIGCRYGYPALAYTDGSKAQLQSLLGTNFSMKSVTGSVYKETGIEIRVSGAGSASHSRHGRVEKAIHCFQMFLDNNRTDIESLSILQFDSVISQACAFLNSMPLCHKKRVGKTVSSSLVSPFSFLIGRRSNMRAPAGYPTLMGSRGEILDAIAKASKGMCEYFTASIPDLLLRPANHDGSKEDIVVGDLVLFPFEDNAITKTYKLALVTGLELDCDDKPRIVELAYANSQEQSLPLNPCDNVAIKTSCRLTRRGVHTLVKIYGAEDTDINTDIEAINASITEQENMDLGQHDFPCQRDERVTLEGDHDPLDPDISFSLIMSQMGYLVSSLDDLSEQHPEPIAPSDSQ